VTDDLTQTDFAYLLDLAGIELPAAEVRPLERRRVLDDLGLTWLFPGLVTTPAARDQVRGWIAAHGRHEPDDRAARQAYAERVVILGEPDLVASARRSLARRLSVVMLDHVGRCGLLAVVGRRAGGYCTELPGLAEFRRLLLCCWPGSDADFELVLIHECCHAWLQPGPVVRRSASALRESRQILLGTALDWGRVDHLARPAALDERRCVQLLRSLGLDENLEEAEQRARRHLHEAAGLEAARRQDEADALEGALADVVADDPDEARA
jgi:hypothetical protein